MDVRRWQTKRGPYETSSFLGLGSDVSTRKFTAFPSITINWNVKVWPLLRTKAVRVAPRLTGTQCRASGVADCRALGHTCPSIDIMRGVESMMAVVA